MEVLKHFWNQSFFIPKPTLTETNLPDQKGRVVIITGGYAGCGKELAKILFQRNGTIYIAGRSSAKAEAAIDDIKTAFPKSQGRLEPMLLDLSDLRTIKPAVDAFLAKEDRLDVLVNNAGVMFPPKGSLSAQKHEVQIATNCLGPYLLTRLLTPLLTATAKDSSRHPGSVRVTWAGSLGVDTFSPRGGVTLDAHGAYVPSVKQNQHENYGASKAGNVFLAVEFARRNPFEQSGVISNSWNPGNLHTELQRHNTDFASRIVSRLMLFPAVFGAYTELFAGWAEEAGMEERHGAYVIPWGRFGSYRQDVRIEVGKQGGNAEKFWDWCERGTKEFC
ncbi:short-chain alcohol dehydrogenase [Saxophila tyrrhenica]|uniref:Short-chain alcohol dehydrogenase n=1 Tax=Saxophila tyrrhenica TaxID=1690608 RepID=A0AAV9PR72_9PEZI|nr:short-chain alcohol dehydrogenase [Saxophila tyrrhenica]